MKQDIIGPQLREALEQAEEPMTATELQELTGASQARVYSWIAKNRGELVEAGVSPTGGKRYVARNHPTTIVERVVSRDTPGIEVGTRLTVTALRVTAGGVVIELTHDDTGARFDASLHL